MSARPDGIEQFEDREDREAVGSVLRAFVYITIPLTLVWAVVYSVTTPAAAPGTWAESLVLVGVGLIALRLCRSHVRAASFIMVCMLWAVIAISCLTGGGVRTPAFGAFSAAIVLAGVLLGSRASIAVTLASVLAGGAFVGLEVAGRLPAPRAPTSTAAWWIGCCLVFGTVATLQHLFARLQRASLARARAEDGRRRQADAARAQAHADLERLNVVLEANERRYRSLFESAAVALFEVDLSRLGALREAWQAQHPAEDFAAALDADPELVDRCAAELSVLDANEQAERLFEAPEKAALLGSYDRLFVPATRKAMVALAAALERGVLTIQQEIEVTTKRERKRRMLFSARRPPPPAPLERIVASAVDVTEQRMLEERTRAAQRMEAIGRFAGGVAHDFNNALAVIMSWVELLRSPSLTETMRREGVEAIGTSANRAAQLTRRLMSIGRRDVRAPRATSITHAVEETMGTMARLLPSDVRVSVEHGTDAFVMVDEGQLHQVLLNLTLNARDAMPEGGSLTVRTRLAAVDDVRDLSTDLGYVELAVQDSGVGMDEATRSRLFEPFFSTKGEGRGTGLGLATVHAIVADSQGKIGVESEPGKGACFRVFLPQAAAPAAASAQPPGAPAFGRGKRVLLVEDEPPVRFVAAHILREGGYEVLEAADGDGALELARSSAVAIDLLCTDGILPGLRTDALIAQFRALFPSAQVLVCSGHVQEELLRRSIADGRCAFVAKPFTPDVLLRAVAELTQSQPPPPPPPPASDA